MGDALRDTLTPLRTAIKFSLWGWGAYWVGAGLILAGAGMADPVSLGLVLLLLATILLVYASGALTPSSRSLKLREWMLEKPVYIMGLIVLTLAGGSLFSPLTNVGIFFLALLPSAGMALLAVRTHRHVRATGKGVFGSGADQVYILLALQAPFVLMMLVDATSGPGRLGTDASLVSIGNWVQLAYPGLLLAASRPFREPLRNPFARRSRKPAVAPAPAP